PERRPHGRGAQRCAGRGSRTEVAPTRTKPEPAALLGSVFFTMITMIILITCLIDP
ncbi:MAG: hypothetical protein UT02_C0064G0006, partial [Parcubacteria group bacterium GW2011_GWC2_38_7]